MKDIDSIVKVTCEWLEKGSAVVIASIIRMVGSSPRHNGARMVVSAGGNSGTIGGGLLEATVIRQSLDVLKNGQSMIIKHEATGKDVNAEGMICGGVTEILLDYIPATDENRHFFRSWLDAVGAGSNFYYLTHLKPESQSVSVLSRSLLFPDGKVTGASTLTGAEIDSIRGELHNISGTALFPFQDTRVIVEAVRKLKTLYIFGAGHVAVPTAHIAALTGFRVVVIDDRAEFACRERFPDAGEVRVIADFNRALEGLTIDTDSFIVILTRGHKFDREVLEQSLRTGAGYIGMISSRRKRDTIFEALLGQGYKKEDLERVHSPIGLPIKAETPEEIAVSIVAELISEREGQKS